MRPVAIVALLLLVAACGDRDERFDEWGGVSAPMVVGETLVYLDGNFDEALVVHPEPGDVSPTWERIPLAAGASHIATLDEEKALLLLSQGAGLLQLLYPESGDIVNFDLGATYDRFRIVDDPLVVGAWYSANATGSAENLVVNQGEVAFIDLTADKDAVRKQVLKTYGGSPLGVDIAPRVPAAGGGRMFAFVRWNSYLSLLDVEKADFAPISIPLKAPDTDAQVFPQTMQFVPRNGRLGAYFIAQGTSDLYALDITVADLAGGAAGLSLNVFPTAAGASTFTTFEQADGDTGIIVLSPTTRIVSVVDPETSDVKQYPLEGLIPTHISLFQMVSPETGVEEQFAFIYNASGSAKSYYYVELHRLAEKKSKAFHRYTTLPAAVRKVYMRGEDTFLVMHTGGNSAMSEVTVSNGSVISMGGGLSLFDERFSADGKMLYALANQFGKTYLLAYDFESGTQRSQDVSYGEKADRLAHMPDAGALVTFDDDGRVLTVVPEDFGADGSEKPVQFFAPFLLGLEH
jgi:hypothetical protein